MTDPHDELRALAADLRALLEEQRLRGVLEEPLDAEAPAADRAMLLDEEALDQILDAEEEAAAPAPPPETRMNAWATAAARARATTRPSHHDDGTGEAGLTAIRADLGECTRCGLCEGRTNVVFGVGRADADLMVIGEGPGANEDLQGEPFVGEAGQLLDRMLERVIGLSRRDVYIANIVKCRPPGNRNPTDDEAHTCLPFLQRQIRAVQPRYILVLGGVALQHLLGVKGIMRNRGRETTWEGIPVMPTFHPAYLLRRPEGKRPVFEDLKAVRARYDELGGWRP